MAKRYTSKAGPEQLRQFFAEASGQSDHPESAETGAPTDFFLEKTGSRIGPYHLLEVLGEGGMGIVYLAEQKQPVRRRVAFKVIKPGMDSARIIARFEAERQALALLEHPNIARVHDGGTTAGGRPYFVMEYVHGLPITDHCDRFQLTIEERLDLFRQVCLAVHQAHQKGIIHRDIKPSNILVATSDDRPVPKIIDFGVAKAISQPLTDSTVFTEHGQLIGTPEYMSPEQAELGNQDVDTRADIYSLGVVLYQLLTGVLPFDFESKRDADLARMRKVICEVEPRTPSTRLTSLGPEAEAVAQRRQSDVSSLGRRLARELEWIPLMALRKERARRYRSAAELADDIENYLKGESLIAGPESTAYRIRKFVLRHRVPVTAACSVAVIMIVAMIISSISTLVAIQARRTAEDQTEAARRQLHVNHMILAHAAYRDADLLGAKDYLNRCLPQFRDFAWHYLWRLLYTATQAPTLNHPGPVSAVAFSPVDPMVATASGNTVYLWHPITHRRLKTLAGHADRVSSLVFSPDGRRLASGSLDGTAALWDPAAGSVLHTSRDPNGPVSALDFTLDGRSLAIGVDTEDVGEVLLWEIQSGRITHLSSGRIFDVSVSADGKILAGTSLSQIILWDTKRHAEINRLKGHTAHVDSAVFLPPGQTLVTAGTEGVLRFWDIETGALSRVINASDSHIHCMCLSPDSRILATGHGDSTIGLWDTETWQDMGRLIGHTGPVRSLAFSPDGQVLASACQDGTVKFWEPASRPDSLVLRGHKHLVTELLVTRDGRHIVSGSFGDPNVMIWDATSGQDQSDSFHGWPNIVVSAVDRSPDGRVIGFGAGNLHLWDMTAQRITAELESPKSEYVNGVAFSPDGKIVASHTFKYTLQLWDLGRQRELARLKGYGAFHGALAFSPDGHYLAVPRRVQNHEAPNVTLWETSALSRGNRDGPALELTGHTQQVNAVVYSPDGSMLATAGDDTLIKLWDTATHTEIATLTGHASVITCLAFSPNGKILASGALDSSTIRLWHLDLLQQVAALQGHDAGIKDLEFTPDGRTLVSGSHDATLRLWRSATEQEARMQPD